MKFFELGEVRPPLDEDFMYFKAMATDTADWKKHHSRKRVRVFSKSTTASSCKMIKVTASFPDISADVLYDTLHDSVYRPSWDKTTRESFEYCRVCPNSSIEYYAMKSPFAFANRDFVLNRVWKILGKDYMIINRSVFHKKLPVRKEYVRALSFITGYLITSTGASSCDFTYLTQNDPRGDIPAWAINLVATSVAPSIMKTLHRAALRYPAWKEQHDPTFMPWRNPAQQSGIVPLVDMADVLSQPDFDRAPIDESYVTEDAALKEVEQQQISNSDNDD
ncbi:putative Phosphatidylcholine transfer protein [Paragonimus heterotremus]|uniref:START domain-containing protein 10 n=1 Tax=Paragonimus heterotremus TaxID=100268 RepID=A0A8J4SM08_9TREM|nr:putative Phosphatidylcholine transfer protein [Paragonimus heterotremus]